MFAIDSLVPAFPGALERIPGRSQAWQALTESLGTGTLPTRTSALIHVAIAQRCGSDYARWVMGRLAERQWVSAEDIFLASAATARDAAEAAIVKAAWSLASDGRESGTTIYRTLANKVGIERATEVLSHAALAMLACEALESIAPSTGKVAAQNARRRMS
jgi:alkylhydroperoxidase family enzyme